MEKFKHKLVLILSIMFTISLLIVPVEARSIKDATLEFYSVVSKRGTILGMTDDNSYIISYSNGSVYFTDVLTDQATTVKTTLDSYVPNISSCFSADKKLLALGNSNIGAIEIIDIPSRKLIYSIDINYNGSLQFSKDGTKLFILSVNGNYIECLDILTEQILYTRNIPKTSVTGKLSDILISPSNDDIAIGYSNFIQIRNLDTWELKKTINEAGFKLRFSNDNKYLINNKSPNNYDYKVRFSVYNISDDYSLKEASVIANSSRLENATFTYDNKMLLESQLFDLESSKISRYTTINDGKTNLYFSNDSKYIYDNAGNIYYSDNAFDTLPPVVGDNETIEIKEVNEHNVLLNWAKANDDDTPQTDLKYYVYKSEADNLNSVEECETNGILINEGGTNDINKINIENLLSNTKYYFNIIVTDDANKKSLYTSVSTTTLATLPVAGNNGIIEINEVTENSVLLNWVKAMEDNIIKSNLKYYIYQSELDNLNTVTQCQANGVLINDNNTDDIDEFRVENLLSNKKYYFNIVVSNSAGKKALYKPASATTLTAPPTVGNNGIIEIKDISDNHILLNWTKATDDNTLESDLNYYVYKSTENNLNSTADCEANGILINEDNTRNIDEFKADNLLPNTKYYFNIVVVDSDYKESLYKSVSGITLTSPPVVGNNGLIEAKEVSENSVLLSWTKSSSESTSQSNLNYYIYQSVSANLSSVNDCEVNGTLVNQTNIKDINEFKVENLLSNTKYYYNIVVVDDNNNKSLYTQMSAITLLAPPVAGNNGIIEVKEISDTFTILNWDKAIDGDSEADLKYFVYRSEINNINSVEDCETNGTLISSNNTNNLNIDNLKPETTYYFNVIVSNNRNQKSIYKSVSVTTLPLIVPPIVGNDGIMEAKGIANDSFLLVWTKAFDEVPLEYYIYQSSSNNLSSVEDCEANGILVNKGGNEDISMYIVRGLSSNTTYYFNVVVNNGENKSIYKTVSLTTISRYNKDKIYEAILERGHIISNNEGALLDHVIETMLEMSEEIIKKN